MPVGLTVELASEAPRRCVNLGLIFRVGDSEGLGLSQGICISHKFLHDADAAEPRLSL